MTGAGEPRVCQNCGRENGPEVHFCACGAYVRWELTNLQMPAVAPPASDPAPQQPKTPSARLVPSPPPPPPAAGTPAQAPPPKAPPAPDSAPSIPDDLYVSGVRPAVPRPRTPEAPPPTGPSGTRRLGAVPPPRQEPPRRGGPPPAAAINLRLPGEDPSADARTLGVTMSPGDRLSVIADVRNKGGIVDEYSLVVHGIPEEWYTVVPETVYLVPFGAAGDYEQEVEIYLHPPRDPTAESRRWDLRVGVFSHDRGGEIASAALALGIHPYEDYTIRVRPERASGRRRAKYEVSILNNANAQSVVILDARDTDDACRFEFDRDAVELREGESKILTLRCRPPRQLWLGRARERRFDIVTATGEDGEKLLEEKAYRNLQVGARKKGLRGLFGGRGMPPGITGPKMMMPQIGLGPGGKLNVGMPNARGPNFRGVNLRQPQGLSGLKMPGQGQPMVVTGPLAPTQAVYRQKAWLPWWLAIVVPLLLLLLLLLYFLIPRTVDVPDLVGKTTFEAQTALKSEKLILGEAEEKATSKAEPGTVLQQAPAAGDSVDKGSSVVVVVAIGSGSVRVPKLAGLTLAEADTLLRDRKLSKGAQLPTPPTDPDAKIERTIPEAGDTVREGTPIDIYYPVAQKSSGAKPGDKPGGKDKPGTAAGGGGPVEVPAIDPPGQAQYAKLLSRTGLNPDPVRRLDTAPRGTVFRTDPAAGTQVSAGSTVRMFVSAGFPRIAYDNEDNVKLANGGTGNPITPAIAKRADQREKDPTWAPDGETVVYAADGRLMSADMLDRSRQPVALTSGDANYADPSFAPTTQRFVLAMGRVSADGDHDLCFGRITIEGVNPQCIVDDRVSVGFAHWSPDGRTILAWATRGSGGDAVQGIVQYSSDRPFSATKSDWRSDGFVTRPGKRGVRDMALSPDGRRLAAVANLNGRGYQLYLTTPDDVELRKAPARPVTGCKVVWIDNQNLAIVKLGKDCADDYGEIVRVDIDEPSKTRPIVSAGDNPTFQPLSVPG